MKNVEISYHRYPTEDNNALYEKVYFETLKDALKYLASPFIDTSKEISITILPTTPKTTRS